MEGGGEEKWRGMVSSSSFYSESESDMFHVNNLSTSNNTDMNMIGFSKTHHHHQLLWKQQEEEEAFPCGMSETTTVGVENHVIHRDHEQEKDVSTSHHHHHHQGLALSLSSTNPLSMGLQSFQLTHQSQHQQQEAQFVVKNSKYLAAAEELLNEFCSLGSSKQSDHHQKKKEDDDDEHNKNVNASKKHGVGSVELVQLQRRKTKLLSMLEEVERRYRQYRNQMRLLEGVGAGVYTALAVKAMSRHFRRVKDGIVGEIEGSRRRMGETQTPKDVAALHLHGSGTTKGDTPRLRIIDQALRQHHISIMDSHPWRPQRGLPEPSVTLLRAWLFDHFLHPYPSDMDKHVLARQTGLSRSQVSNWFINARVRLWKPMVEEMYMQELKEQEDKDNNNMANSSDHQIQNHNNNNGTASDDPNIDDEEKPMQQQLRRMDSECTVSSSIINHNNNHVHNNSNNMLALQHHHRHYNNEQEGSAFGSVELDFSQQYSGGVSLTLGLQAQEGGNGSSGVSLAFPPPNHPSLDLFYPTLRDDSAHPPSSLHYSLFHAQQQHNINLPYTNFMGAHLLHDFAG